MAWPTAQTVLAQAGVELGLLSASDLGDDAFTSSDSTVLQLLALLKKAGRDLVDEFNWQQLRAEYSILTQTAAAASAAGQSTWGAVPLPYDWRSMTDQSGWNRTNRLPLGGPLSEQEWQFLSSRVAGVVWTVLFRPMQGLMFLYPSTATPAAQQITVAYKSSWWVQRVSRIQTLQVWAAATLYNFGDIVGFTGPGKPFVANLYRCVRPGTSGAVGPDPAKATTPYVPVTSGALVDGTCIWNWIGVNYLTSDGAGTTYNTFSVGNADSPITGADTLMFDEELLVAKLKLAWLVAKGFDSSAADAEYQRQLGTARGANTSAPMLSLNGSGLTRDRLLGGLSVPITGFGS